MKDRDLLLALLQKAALSEPQREVFARELSAVELFNRKMSPVNRRHAEAVARVKGVIPQRPTHGKKKNIELHRGEDMYSTRVTPGTAFAERVLAGRPVAPPSRRKAS